MRLRIHRGAQEIGGTCIELEANSQRLVLDLGLPISAKGDPARFLPRVPGLSGEGSDRPLAVLLSHPHQDHVGLASLAHPSIPVYLGREADQIMQAAVLLGAPGTSLQNARHYQHRQPVEVGPFVVTPYLVDHSAFDAYAFLIEAGNRRLFYSGDLRAHGRKGRMFRELLAKGPKNLDAMLLEGTTLGREQGGPSPTEDDLEDKFVNSMQATDGLVLASFSAQNIDRFTTVYRAARKSGRTFAIDLYFAHLLRAIGRKSLPDPADSDLRVFLPTLLKRRIKQQGLFDLVAPFRKRRIYLDEVTRRVSRLAMTFRPSFAKDFEGFDSNGGRLIYSQWPGYLERDRLDLRKWCQRKGMAFEVIHTSGHADKKDLIALVAALDPGFVIPVHTIVPEAYDSIFPRVRQVPDGAWLDLNAAQDLRVG